VDSLVSMILPLIILLIVLAVVIYSCVIIAKEIHELYKSATSEDSAKEVKRYEEEIMLTVE